MLAPREAAPPTGGTAYFFAATLGFTWVLQLPAVLAQRGLIPGTVERYFLLAGLGGFGPLLAAVLLARFEPGGAGVRALFRPLGTWRVGARWYVVALGIFGVIYVAGVGVYTLLGGTEAVRWLYPPENAQHVAALLIVPFTEEVGWRGFALPRLQRRHGALRASLLLGVGWALWHTMMLLLQGATPTMFGLAMVNITAGSVVFSWIYHHTRGSLLLAVLAHAGVHLNNPFHAVPGTVTPLATYTAAMVVAAVALVVFDRRAWRDPTT